MEYTDNEYMLYRHRSIHSKKEGELMITNLRLVFSTNNELLVNYAWGMISNIDYTPANDQRTAIRMKTTVRTEHIIIQLTGETLEKRYQELLKVKMICISYLQQYKQQSSASISSKQPIASSFTNVLTSEKLLILRSNVKLARDYHELVEISQIMTEDEFWKLYAHMLEDDHSSINQQSIYSTTKGQKNSVLTGLMDTKQKTFTITNEIKRDIFHRFPYVRIAFDQNVPHIKTEAQFWDSFIKSEIFSKKNSSFSDNEMFLEIKLKEEEKERELMKERKEKKLRKDMNHSNNLDEPFHKRSKQTMFDEEIDLQNMYDVPTTNTLSDQHLTTSSITNHTNNIPDSMKYYYHESQVALQSVVNITKNISKRVNQQDHRLIELIPKSNIEYIEMHFHTEYENHENNPDKNNNITNTTTVNDANAKKATGLSISLRNINDPITVLPLDHLKSMYQYSERSKRIFKEETEKLNKLEISRSYHLNQKEKSEIDINEANINQGLIELFHELTELLRHFYLLINILERDNKNMNALNKIKAIMDKLETITIPTLDSKRQKLSSSNGSLNDINPFFPSVLTMLQMAHRAKSVWNNYNPELLS